jgi:hypothetical protein
MESKNERATFSNMASCFSELQSNILSTPSHNTDPLQQDQKASNSAVALREGKTMPKLGPEMNSLSVTASS